MGGARVVQREQQSIGFVERIKQINRLVRRIPTLFNTLDRDRAMYSESCDGKWENLSSEIL